MRIFVATFYQFYFTYIKNISESIFRVPYMISLFCFEIVTIIVLSMLISEEQTSLYSIMHIPHLHVYVAAVDRFFFFFFSPHRF